MQTPQIVEIRQHGKVVAVAALAEDRGRVRAVDAGGHECSFPPARVLCATGVVVASDEPAGAAVEVEQYERRQSRVVRSLDVEALWSGARDIGRTASLEQLAVIGDVSQDGEGAAAVLRAVVADGLRFRVRARDVQIFTVEEVDAALQARRDARRQLEVWQSTVQWLRGEAAGPPTDADTLIVALRTFAAQPEQPPARDPSAILLREAGIDPTPAAAFQRLVQLGVMQHDENLLLIRHGLDRDFSGAVLEAAAAASTARVRGATRRDLRDWPTFSVDEHGTTEVDDALSVRALPGGGARVGIHLADPGAFFDSGSLVDRAGRDRQTTLYLPERKRLMVPAVLSEATASLLQGHDRPAFSVIVELDAAGHQTGVEIVQSLIRVDRAIRYDIADDEIDRGGELGLLADLADRSRERRIAAGAVETGYLAVNPVVREDGTVDLARSSGTGRSRRMVAEFMVQANREVARYCRRHELAVPYRRQELREPIPEGLDLTDRFAIFLATRCLGKAWTDVHPGRHQGLALDEYVQVTSPLRRYLDLVTQRQVVAHIDGEPPPLDEPSILELIRVAQPVLSRARMVSAGSRAYWLLRWLQQNVGAVVDAVVLKIQRRQVRIELLSLTYRLPWRPPRPVRPGERLRLRVDAADPRAGQVSLSLVELVPEEDP